MENKGIERSSNLVVSTTNNMKPETLDGNLIYLCTQFSHQFNLHLAAEFRKNRIFITAEQFSVLVFLWYRDGMNQKEISGRLNRDKTTVARVVRNMKKALLITQQKDPADKRFNIIRLTSKGKQLQNRALQVSGNAYLRVLGNVDPDRLKTSIGLLQVMLQNL
jgi:DNA-binding MarR family transcriptional regulator